MPDFLPVGVDHAIDMVAVDAVEPHAHPCLQQVLVLEVPSEGPHTESMDERDQSAVPIRNVHVQNIDLVLGEDGCPPLDALGDAREAGGIHDPHLGEVSSSRQYVILAMETEPEPRGVEIVVPADRVDQSSSFRVLDVDAEVAGLVERLENGIKRGNVAREFLEVELGDGNPACASANDAVVVEHDPSVARHPCIRLEAICAEPQGQLERFQGVFAGVRSCTPMGKADRSIRERWKALLHPTRLRPRFYAGDVFNLSGSEIVFLLLAGLVVLGPERLPGVVRRVGRTYGEMRRTLNEYERDFKRTFKEPLDEVRSTVKDFKSSIAGVDTTPSPPMRPEKSADPAAPGGSPAPSSPFSNAEMSAHPDRWKSDVAASGGQSEAVAEGTSDDEVKDSGDEDGSHG